MAKQESALDPKFVKVFPGVPPEWWKTIAPSVREFIQNEKLVAAKITAKQATAATPMLRSAQTEGLPWSVIIRGGYPGAHLHLGDKVYPLTEQQWQRFSGGVRKEAMAKLSASDAIGFGTTIGVAAASQSFRA